MTMDAIFVQGGTSARRPSLSALSRAWTVLRAWSVKRRTRHALLDMTEDQLRDIGVTRREAQREAEKSYYWD